MAFADQLSSIQDKLKDQEWYQQIQNSYQQLSPEQQSYLKWGGLGATLFVFIYFTWQVLSSSNAMKSEYYEKQELLQLVNQASDEIRRLKGQSAGFTPQGAVPWRTVVQGWVTGQGLNPDAFEIIKETPGASQNIIQETLLEVSVKGIGLRPMVQLLYQIEHGNPPVKLKGLQIDPQADGNLNLKMNLSGYMPKPEKK